MSTGGEVEVAPEREKRLAENLKRGLQMCVWRGLKDEDSEKRTRAGGNSWFAMGVDWPVPDCQEESVPGLVGTYAAVLAGPDRGVCRGWPTLLEEAW